MIEVYYGDDFHKRTKEINNTINTLVSTKENSLVARFDETNWSEHTILSYTESQGLFDTQYVVVFDRVCDDKNKIEFIFQNIERFNFSPNSFIFSENIILKDVLKKFEKAGATINSCLLQKTIKPKSNDVFAIANAFGVKDKKTAWVLYLKQIEQGESPEAIAGMLFWKIKTMIVSQKFSPFTKQELQKLSSGIVSIYHNARVAGDNLTINLEKFILKSL